MRSRPTIIRLTIVLLVLAAGLGGCTKQIPIYRIPAFWQPGEFEGLAVMPFRNASTSPAAGELVTAAVAAHLAANGTYDRVYKPQDLHILLNRRGLQDYKESEIPQLLAELDDAQAALTGTVLMMDGAEEREHRREPIYKTDRSGNQYIARYRDFYYYFNHATVSVTASLVSTKTGETLHSTLAPIQAHVESEGEDPDMTMQQCALEAVDQVVVELVSQFAIIETVIEVDPNKAFLITAGEYYDGEWEERTSFSADETEVVVVIKLPRDADRNTFRLAVARKGEHDDLAEAEFTWSRDFPARGHEIRFDPSKIAAAGGPGAYVVKFYAGADEPVMDKPFTITE